MDCTMLKPIKTTGLPATSTRRYVRIYSKTAKKMFSSSSTSPLSKKNERPSRPNTPSIPTTPQEELSELSDVPCYTCRRRHVKCDRILPTCAKCAKKGVPCLGYQKPLRWAEGVAVRGKLKGKSQPVVDSKVVSIVQNTMQVSSSSALEEAAHFGLHATGNSLTDVATSEATFLELMTYHNTRMCAENITFEQSKFIDRTIAPLSIEVIEKLPRVVVNGILGNAAVHMASRQPGNRSAERLALEAKVKVFQSFNNLLQSSQNQQPDVIVTTCALVFAMDLIEYGMNRWMVHFLGTSQVMSSFGGVENLFTYYPHLQLVLTHMAYFETLWVLLSHVPITKPKQTSRRAVEMLCTTTLVKRRFYNPCPASLTLSVWDIGACASKILSPRKPISPSDLSKRDQILLDVLAFRPEDGTKDVKEWYYKDIPVTETRIHHWDLISTAWKGAITILTLRYLYFGRSDLAPKTEIRRSPTPSLATPAGSWHPAREDTGAYFQSEEDINFGDFLEEIGDPESLPEYLSAGLAIHDPLSRSPSPLPSPLPFTEPPASSPWPNRYEIHNDAFAALYNSFFTMHDTIDPICLRYVLLPLHILALTSRKDSPERALCLSYFAKWKEFFSTNYPPDTVQSPQLRESSASPTPQGGEQLDLNLPWDRLDAYSDLVEQQRGGSPVQGPGGLTKCAPEWNWWDMLSHVKIDTVWPISSGTSHFERGSEFWAFKLISSVVNDECLSIWTNPPTAQASSSSA